MVGDGDDVDDGDGDGGDMDDGGDDGDDGDDGDGDDGDGDDVSLRHPQCTFCEAWFWWSSCLCPLSPIRSRKMSLGPYVGASFRHVVSGMEGLWPKV